jgi:mRNA interferase RelE/StbE
MYSIIIERNALKSLAAIPGKDATKIVNAINELAENARPNGVKKLKGYDGLYRIKIGNYRIIYEINDGELSIIVVEIGHRKDVYRDL